MTRITIKNLQSVCDRLNRITNSPMVPYAGGVAQIGNYHISQAYGGYCLHRMHNDGGGVSSPLSTGHIPARELFGLMYAFIYGIETARGAK